MHTTYLEQQPDGRQRLTDPSGRELYEYPDLAAAVGDLRPVGAVISPAVDRYGYPVRTVTL